MPRNAFFFFFVRISLLKSQILHWVVLLVLFTLYMKNRKHGRSTLPQATWPAGERTEHSFQGRDINTESCSSSRAQGEQRNLVGKGDARHKTGSLHLFFDPPPRSSHSLLTATQRSAPAETPRPKKISNRGIKPLRPPQKEREAKEEESSRNTGRRKRTTGLRRSAGGCLSVPTAATGS